MTETRDNVVKKVIEALLHEPRAEFLKSFLTSPSAEKIFIITVTFCGSDENDFREETYIELILTDGSEFTMSFFNEWKNSEMKNVISHLNNDANGNTIS